MQILHALKPTRQQTLRLRNCNKLENSNIFEQTQKLNRSITSIKRFGYITMAEEAQVCERLRGQDTCPFHSGHNISSLCKTCSILVCLECMTSSTHEGHTFKKIKDCLREPTNNLTRYLHKIDQILLKHVEKDVLATENEMKLSIHKQINDVQNLKDQSVEFKKEIEANTAGMIGLVNQHAHSVLEVLSQHITLLETLREYLLSEKKECQDTLAKGSEILRYDAGNETGEKINQINVPEHPKIQELQHIRMRWDNAQLLIRNAMGSLKDVKPKSTETTSTDTSSTPLPVSCAIHPSALSQFNNESPYFYAVTPITKATAWAGEYRHNISDNSYTTGNTLNLITNRGKLLRQITTDVPFRSLYIHPKTGMLYVGCYGDETLRGVDTTSGITDILFTCDIKPHRIKVTSDDQILVGTYGENNKVYRYLQHNMHFIVAHNCLISF